MPYRDHYHHPHHCKVSPVFCPPLKICKNCYHPVPVPVVHPIEVIRRHHLVPVPRPVYTYSERDVLVDPCGFGYL
ncbi:hypothetical protein ABNC71_00910 [Paenibacillus larvae]